MAYRYFLIFFSIAFSTMADCQISSIEKKIAASVDRNEVESLDFLKRIVNINSGTMNIAGVRKVGEEFAEQYRKLGFQVEWISGDSFGRAGHLIATRLAPKGPKILMIGHLDTVFEPDSPFQEYKMVSDHLMNGPGALDMKGGDVVMLLALKALHEQKLLDNFSVKVFLVGDEELSGEPLALSKKDLIEAGKWADIALGYEDGDGTFDHANISRRGSADWTLKVKGLPAHSSQIFQPEVGAGAIYEASRILNEFYRQLSLEENFTFNPGLISGGNSLTVNEEANKSEAFGKNNIVSAEVFVTGDMRAVSKEQLIRTRKIMQEIVANSLPHTSASIEFGDDGYPPMTMTEGNKRLLGIFSKVSEDLGFGPVFPVNPRNSGAADISFVADDVKMAMDAIGLCGTGGHTVEETADITCLPKEAKRTAILLYRLKDIKF